MFKTSRFAFKHPVDGSKTKLKALRQSPNIAGSIKFFRKPRSQEKSSVEKSTKKKSSSESKTSFWTTLQKLFNGV